MSHTSDAGQVTDHLRVQLTNGQGKKIFDSDDKIPNIGFPKEPLKFCPNCGGETQPIIYMCKCCGERFMQQEDRKTGRKLVISLPAEKAPTDAIV
jgi:hypothetical protein